MVSASGNPQRIVDGGTLEIRGDRPVPMPSVIDEPPSVFRTPSLMEVVERAAGRITRTILTAPDFAFRYRAVPASVPPVPGCAEGVDFAVGIVPDFRSRRLEMSIAIRRIVELIGPNGVGQFLRQAARHLLIWLGLL